MRKGDDYVAAQRALAATWGFRCYEDALRSWIATVAIIEAGYVGEWEDYTHELWAREYLDEVAYLSPGSRAAIDEDVRIWDERFRAVTVEEAEPHLPRSDSPVGWWQYRSPRKWRRPASEELEAHNRAALVPPKRRSSAAWTVCPVPATVAVRRTKS